MFFNTHGEAFVNQYVTLVACNVINDKLTCLPIPAPCKGEGCVINNLILCLTLK